jgi:WD40 repeat protein
MSRPDNESVIPCPEAADLPLVGDHELCSKIAEGSYGEVWLARNRLGHLRAVKVVRRARFATEAPYLRELEAIRLYEPHSREHDGLVDVLQVGHDPPRGVFYYVMELADRAASGTTGPNSSQLIHDRSKGDDNPTEPSGDRPLAAEPTPPVGYVARTLEYDVRTGGRLPVAACIQLALNLADALDHLHGCGLVHRDVKPANVIFVAGRAKLADPGSITDALEPRTLIGTEGFMPPEGRGSQRGDLYSLGRLLYHASTGKPATEFPNPPLDLDRWDDHQVWLELNEVLERACSFDPAQRYASAAEFRADLAVIAAGRSLRAQHRLSGRLAWMRRIAAGLGVAVLLGAGVGYWQYRQARSLARATAQVHLTQAFQRIEAGELLRSLPYLVKALELDRGGPAHEDLQRLRLGRVALQCPTLVSLGIHTDGLYAAEFSPDGGRVLTASADFTAQVWNVRTGRPVAAPARHSNEVRHATFDPSGRRFATASVDGTARVWDAATGDPVSPPLEHGAAVSWAAFRGDGQVLATAALDGMGRVWNATTGDLLHELRGHSQAVSQIEFNAAGDRIVTVSQDATGRLWNAATGQQIAQLDHADGVRCAEFSADNRLLATGSRDGSARLWDARDGAWLGLAFSLGVPVYQIRFSEDGRRLLVAGGDRLTRGAARVWDTTTGQAASPDLIHGVQIRNAALSRDGQWAATRSDDPVVRLWEVASGRAVRPGLPHPMAVRTIQFSADRQRLLTSCRDGAWRLWDLSAPADEDTLMPPPGREWRMAFLSPQGERLAAVDDEGQVRFYRMPDAALLKTLSLDHPADVAVFSPDGLFIAVKGARECAVFDGSTYSRVLSLPRIDSSQGFAGPIFSPASDAVAFGVGGGIRVWDFRTGQPLTGILSSSDPLAGAAFSRDGRLLAAAFLKPGDYLVGQRDRGEARVWEARTGRLVKVLPHPLGVRALCFSPDGRLLMTGCAGGWPRADAYLWDVRTLAPHLDPLPHDDGVTVAAFSPDSLRLATGSASGTLRIWDTRTGRPIGRLMNHDRGVGSVAFSPDGRLLASGGIDRVVRIWRGHDGEPLAPPLVLPNLVEHVEFSPDGRFLIALSRGSGLKLEPSVLRICRLKPDLRPLAELARWAEAQAGFCLDSAGRERLLEPAEVRARLAP